MSKWPICKIFWVIWPKPIYSLSNTQRMKVAVEGFMEGINLFHFILFKIITSATFILSSTDSTLAEYNLCYTSLINIGHFLAHIGRFAQKLATFGWTHDAEPEHLDISDRPAQNNINPSSSLIFSLDFTPYYFSSNSIRTVFLNWYFLFLHLRFLN